MTDLEKMRSWVASYPDFDILGAFQIDYTDRVPQNGGLFPAGLVEVERRSDILGNTTVTNQLNFGLYCVLYKPENDDETATVNADWIMGFQQWVQEQSVRGRAPRFGDVPRAERITAQNGMLFDADQEGCATYMVQLSVQYIKKYEVD